MIDLAQILRRRVDVVEIPGWRTHVRPGEWQPVGVMVHHTAGTKSLATIVNGRPDLAGPLANVHIPKAGPVNLVSAGRCNHAGEGAAVVLGETTRGVAPSGDALARGLPDGVVGNGFFYSIEAENFGDGEDPWPAGQLLTIARAAGAICAYHGWTSARVIGHLEWTRRKPDPRGFAMDDLRARVAQVLGHTEDDNMTDDQVNQLLGDVAAARADALAAKNYGVDGQARLVALAVKVDALAAGGGVDIDALAERVADRLAQRLAD